MKDPTYGIIDDIAPGGGDYTTLQGWYDDVYDDGGNIHHARCGTGDVGALITSMAGAHSWPTTASQPAHIYAADGAEQDGSLSVSQGARIAVSDGNPALVLDTNLHWAVGGLRIVSSSQNPVDIAVPTGTGTEDAYILMERNAVLIDVGDNGFWSGFYVFASDLGTGTVILRNNLIKNIGLAPPTILGGAQAIYCGCADTPPAGVYEFQLLANSIAQCQSTLPSLPVVVLENMFGVDQANARFTCKNNIYSADWGDPANPQFATAGLVTLDQDYEVASDESVAGVNSLKNKAPSTIWADIADADTPFAPKPGGVIDDGGNGGYGPNGANLFSEGTDGVIVDAVGAERPSQGAHYRGGQEIFAGLYKAYGGPTSSEVDYGVMLESVRAGTNEIDITPVRVASGGEYWLAVRATSAAGIEETNTDRLTRAVVDEAGDLQPLPLAAVRELTAELQTDGSVIVGFTHTTSPGWATPTEFEVLTDNGTGELNLTTPAAIINVTDAGVGDYEAAVAASTLPAKFSARARSGAETGPVAPPVTVSLPAGPAAVEET